MLHVDDLIEPGAKQILLTRLPPFPWPHPNLRSSIVSSKESRLPIRRNPSFEFARQSTAAPEIPAKSITEILKYPATSGNSAFFTVDNLFQAETHLGLQDGDP
jgi:hypothetical protein